MLTNNYYAILANSYSRPNNKVQLTAPDGTKFTQKDDEWDELNFGSAQAISTGNILFGSGTTPPTRDDYTLSGASITTLDQQSMVGSYELLDDGVKFTKILFMNNTGTEAVTVGEIAWVTGMIPYSSLNGKNNNLLDRTLLEEPVTIQPGGTAQINYSIFFKYGS